MILAVDTGQLHADYHTSQDRAADNFAARLKDVVDRFPPSRVVCAFDMSHPTFRHALSPEYKADRGEVVPELRSQFDRLMDHLTRERFECVGAPGFEADDIIASVSHQTSEPVIIFSQDKDCRQLLEKGRVTILRQYNKSKGGGRVPVWYSADTLFEEYGLTPDQWVDFQCIVGDGVDKIIGVDGIGAKGAVKMLAGGRTLRSILDDLDSVELTQRQKEKLSEFAVRYDIVRQLVTLRRDVALA